MYLKKLSLALLVAAFASGCAQTRHALNDIELPTLPSLSSVRAATAVDDPSAALAEAPPDAKPGECYARVTQPATLRSVSESVVDQPETERLVTVPATYREVTERVMVEEASEKVVVIPATYKTVTETVVIEPAQERIVPIPARYETKTERVKVAEAYTTWKKGVNPIAFSGGPEGTLITTAETEAGEIMCLVEIPAQYETRTVKVLVEPADTKIERAPAKTRTITRRVVDTPATTRVERIPAKFAEVKKKVVVTPESVRREPVAATYRTVTRQVPDQPARTYWASVLCETNATPEIIRSLQSALKRRGLYTGAVDGIYGPLTARAVRRFQGRDGMVSMDALRELGVAI